MSLEPDVAAAIVAALRTLEENETPPEPKAPSRWRRASFEADEDRWPSR